MANRRVAIVGASTSDCGRVDDKTAFQLNYQGTTRALAEAGIGKDEVDGFGALTGALPPVELAEYLGIRPNWVVSDVAEISAMSQRITETCSSSEQKPGK